MPQLRLIALALAVVMLAVLAGCGGGGGGGSAAIATGGVAGYVFESTREALSLAGEEGTPLAGADVRVKGSTLATQTDDQGYFQLTGVPAGPRELVITKSGHAGLTLSTMVVAGQVTTLPVARLTPVSRKWTVLVFMNADNDLETFGIQDMNEMEAVPDSEQVSVLVQMDRISGYDSSHDNWTGCRRYQIRHDTDTAAITSPMLEDMGEVDMGDPRVLQDFIAWGQLHYPAEHYLLVIWNHGSGWRSRMAMESAVTRGVSFDDTSYTFIRTVDLPAALTATSPFEIVAFDASLMQMLEIAYEIRNTCAYVVGSEESPPGAGYAYHTWLGPLVEDPSLSAAELANVMARETLNYYGRYSDITHSVIDTAQLPALAQAVSAFADKLIAYAGSDAAIFAAARSGTERFKYPEYKDLCHYAELVKAGTARADVRASADGVISAVQRATPYEYHGSLHPNAHGVSIFIPTPAGYPGWISAQYLPLALSQDSRWDEWLAAQQQ